MIGFQKYSLIDNVNYKKSEVNKNKTTDFTYNDNLNQRIIKKNKKYVVKGQRTIINENKYELKYKL